MTEKPIIELNELEPGDIVRGKTTGLSYVVTDNYGQYVIATRVAHITNPNEWIKIIKDKE